MSTEPATTTEQAAAPLTGRRVGWVFLSLTRIAIGFIFLWAFFDKLFGLGFSTCRDPETGTITVMCDSAWLKGAAVTEGYLNSSSGPFADFFKGLADERWTDWIFMAGLLGIGFALCFGVGTKVALFVTPLMLALMYISHSWPNQGGNTTNPFVDDHVIEALAVIGIVLVELGHQSIGFGEWWKRKVGVKHWTV